MVEEVLRLYRERYFDFNVRHFHEKLGSQHGIKLSYTWVKLALQTAGWWSGEPSGAGTIGDGSAGLCQA